MAVRLTAVSVEALEAATPALRLTAVSAEAAVVGSPTARLTALSVEVLVPLRGYPDGQADVTRLGLVLPGGIRS